MKSTLVTIAACLLLTVPLLASGASAPDAAEAQPAVASAAAAATPPVKADTASTLLLCGIFVPGFIDPAAQPLARKGGRDDDSWPDPVEPCLTGWCSNNVQCEEWFEPGCICRKQPGATCGQCICP
jgi:hypothetical protein